MLLVLAEAALRSLLLGSAVGLGLKLLRVRNPHAQMTAWSVVLAASLLMPLVMQWSTVTIVVQPSAVPAPPAAIAAPQSVAPIAREVSDWSASVLPDEPATPAAISDASHRIVSLSAVATALYLLVAGLFLLRLVVGMRLTWRLACAAEQVTESWIGHADLRVSREVRGPVTFGRVILIPPQCLQWDLARRRAMLAHEGAHVANRDFYLLLLAQLNRALFWFSPFAWWQQAKLAELAEIVSDTSAIEAIDDRVSYAEMLLDVVQAGGRRTVGGLEMARASTVRARVERILAITALPTAIGWRKRIAIVAILVPVAALAAVTIATRIEPAAALAVAREPEPQRPQRTAFYALRPGAIFAISQSGDQLFGQLTGQRRLRLAAVGEGSYAYAGASGQLTFALQDVAQSPAELALHQNGRDIHAARIAEFPQDGEALDAGQLDEYAGWYALGESRVLAVTHVGERLQLQETGGTPIEVSADWADAFSDRRNDLVMFLRDNKTNVDRLLLLDPIAGARVARRIDAARARAIESEFARRIAQAPDRFRLQVPSDGTKEAVLRGIEDLRRGTPSYDRMSVSLAAKIQHQEKELHAMFVALGATQSIFFRGVGPGGYDIYGVKFANGSAEFRVLLGADGRAEDVLFHPYGNDEPGDVLACSNEHAVRARAGEAPIRMYFYNSSGGDVQFYSLDQDGTRTVHGSVGDNTTWATTTSVGTPWMIADREGKCLEIVLPGQHTRSHKIEPPGATPLGGAQRSTPQDGGEEMLRHYIEAVGRGQPDYDHMTAEVATQTRLSLPFDRAILARLGPLRAMSFRGVSKVGSDIYIVQFANGSAEWRIALASDGSIGRVALGPSY